MKTSYIAMVGNTWFGPYGSKSEALDSAKVAHPVADIHLAVLVSPEHVGEVRVYSDAQEKERRRSHGLWVAN